MNNIYNGKNIMLFTEVSAARVIVTSTSSEIQNKFKILIYEYELQCADCEQDKRFLKDGQTVTGTSLLWFCVSLWFGRYCNMSLHFGLDSAI